MKYSPPSSVGASWRRQDSRDQNRFKGERRQQRRARRRARSSDMWKRLEAMELYLLQLQPEHWPYLAEHFPELQSLAARLQTRPHTSPELRVLVEDELTRWFPALGVAHNGENWLSLQSELLTQALQLAAQRLTRPG